MARSQKTAYGAALKAAQKDGYKITRETVAALKAGFEDAIKDLLRDKSSNPIVAAQQQELRRELKAMLRELDKLARTVTQKGVTTTLNDIVAIHAGVVKDLVKNAGGSQAARLAVQRFNRIPIRAVTAMNAKRQAGMTFQTLIERNIADAAPELDILLTRGISQGMSPARLTDDIADLLIGDNPRGLGDYGLDPEDVSGVRTLYSDARRIAVSETNNALREANTSALKESPVLAATWQRSGRHDALKQKRDRCDDYAEEDNFGLGKGVWLVEEWPAAPHPYCACVQGGPVVYMEIEDWMGMKGIESDEDFEE